MVGISKYEGKDKRRQRLRNHIAKDVHSPKYAQRVVPSGRSRKTIITGYVLDPEDDQEGYYDDEL